MSRGRLLVTGATGFLGREICRRAEKRWPLYAAFASHPERTTHGEPVALDLTAPNAAERIADLRPTAVIHTAACNANGPASVLDRVNVGGTRAVAEACRRVGARLVHVSTDVVHDGRRAPYRDDEEPSPLFPYARSKAAAEEIVLRLCAGAVIVRTSLVYDPTEIDRATATFAERARSGTRLELYTDVLRQPIDRGTLAEALLQLVEGPFAGRLNVAGTEVWRRADFARRLLDWWQIPFDAVDLAAADRSTETPLDLRLRLDRVHDILDLDLSGVSDRLAGARPPGAVRVEGTG